VFTILIPFAPFLTVSQKGLFRRCWQPNSLEKTRSDWGWRKNCWLPEISERRM